MILVRLSNTALALKDQFVELTNARAYRNYLGPRMMNGGWTALQ